MTDAMRSSPAPVSTEGLGRFLREPSGCKSYCMKTRFQISSSLPSSFSWTNCSVVRSPLPRSFLERRSTLSSVLGPAGPVSAICQKLSLSPSPKIRESAIPVTWCHSVLASSSEWWTVT